MGEAATVMKIGKALLLGIACWPISGCVHRFRINPVDSAPMAESKSLHISATGNGFSEPVVNAHCSGNGVAEVIVSRNFGQRFLSVASLGFYDPVMMQWKCAKDSYVTAEPF
jgi:hypothetical protein